MGPKSLQVGKPVTEPWPYDDDDDLIEIFSQVDYFSFKFKKIVFKHTGRKVIVFSVSTTKDKQVKFSHICLKCLFFLKNYLKLQPSPSTHPRPSAQLVTIMLQLVFCVFTTYVYTCNKQYVLCLKMSQLVSLLMLICVALVCFITLFICPLHRSVFRAHFMLSLAMRKQACLQPQSQFVTASNLDQSIVLRIQMMYVKCLSQGLGHTQTQRTL